MMDILVYMDWGMGDPECIGVLHFESIRGKDVFSFSGGKAWASHKEFRMLDPDLGQFEGPQYLREGKRNFGLFLDSSPDRWGRFLIKRREALQARQQNRSPKILTESDFLLGVYDGNRMGALRFKLDQGGSFLDDNKELATPPVASLRDLEYASLQIANEDNSNNPEYAKWLNMLLRPGSSLGGARPKANVIDTDGNLWIAKFPDARDSRDVGAWEKIVNELAASCGISVPETTVKKFSGPHHTFMTKRFDRTPKGERIHFASAMTLLGEQDGADFSSGVSYLDMVKFICLYGINIESNLEELWRRMVFNIAVSNCDDHLRNHGFILTASGWTLSPAFDINPDEYGAGLKLNISEHDNSLVFDLAMEVIPYFRISRGRASAILNDIKASVLKWHDVADKYGISRQEQEMVSPAFNN